MHVGEPAEFVVKIQREENFEQPEMEHHNHRVNSITTNSFGRQPVLDNVNHNGGFPPAPSVTGSMNRNDFDALKENFSKPAPTNYKCNYPPLKQVRQFLNLLTRVIVAYKASFATWSYRFHQTRLSVIYASIFWVQYNEFFGSTKDFIERRPKRLHDFVKH